MLDGLEKHIYSNQLTEREKSQAAVLNIVSRDLNSYLNEGNDRQKRLNFLSRKVGVHKKTLQRIAMKENNPSYTTIMNLYRFLLNVDKDYEIFEKVDAVVKKYLEVIFSHKETIKQEYKNEDLKLFSENSVALDLYILASVKKISRVDIRRLYGEFGMRMADQLLAEGFISEINPGIFSEGRKKVSFAPEMITKAGLLCVQNYAKPLNAYESNKNYMSFYSESLNAKAFAEWISIDQEAFTKKVNLASKKESKGDIPVFSFNIMDTLKCED